MTQVVIPRLVIAGTHSGVGKTTITAGLIAALRQRGLKVQPFKVGPDYIDPSYHTLAAKRVCRNLDTWMAPTDRVQALFANGTQEADIAIVEGVMGFYDGLGYDNEAGSTAEVARLLGAPTVLVIDAGGMARSAGAVAYGYQQFAPDLPVAGFILNQVGGDAHGRGVAVAIERATALPVLGWLPRDSALEIPERHLGLVPTAEPGRWQDFIQAASNAIARHIDLDRLLTIATAAPPLIAPCLAAHGRAEQQTTAGGPVIAVARDEVFSFTYEDNLDLLRAAGAEIAFFSPLHDHALPLNATGVILSGGFPELYASQLAENVGMRQALHEAHTQQMPIYAECGGLMYLTQAIVDLDGREHPMVGLLPGRSVMSGKLTLGYRLVWAADDSWMLSAGEPVRGHEFHYSLWEDRPSDLLPAYKTLPRSGEGEACPEGAHQGNLLASYIHVHFWGKPELATRFVQAALEARKTCG